MDDNINVNVEELKQICNKMIDEKNEIMNIYNSNIKKVTESSEQVLGINGIETNNISVRLEELFAKFDKSMTELTDTLSDNIVPGFINLNEDIKNLFGNQFADEMENLMNNKE